MREGSQILELLGAVAFRADPGTLTTTLEGAGARALLGRTPDVPLPPSQLWDELVLEPERAALLAMLRAVATDGVARCLDHPARVRGRSAVWLRTLVERVAPPGSQAPALFGLMLDITAVRATERHAQEVEAWLVALGESLPFDFWICDRQGRLILQNADSRRRLGNVVGQRAEDTVARGAGEQGQRGLARALAGERVRAELRGTVEGEERIFSRVLSPVREHPGAEPTGALAVDLDVTELKRVEQRLRHSLDELQRTQGELLRKERLAVLGEMAGTVAHEVRNPLGAMFNVTQLLRKKAPATPETTELLSILSEELNRLDDMVVNLFDLVRPLEPQLRAQSLIDVVDEAVADALRVGGADGKIRVIREVERAPLEATMDAPLLGLALKNVLRNALQAMPEGGELAVRVGQDQHGGQTWARIAIVDTGPGMPSAVRERIFEPFFTTRPTGSGLGLAIVQRVIAEHHGELEVRSAPGEGTAFVLRLPCVQPPGAEP